MYPTVMPANLAVDAAGRKRPDTSSRTYPTEETIIMTAISGLRSILREMAG